MSSPTVLIVTNDAAFSRDLIGRWQTERLVPGFTVIGPEITAVPGAYDLAVVGPMPVNKAAAVLRVLEHRDAPVLCLVESTADGGTLRAQFFRPMIIRKHETWLDSVMLVAVETLRRLDAAAKLRRTEMVVAEKERLASLGEYMLQNRHGYNNVLTSLLGNAELLQQDAERLPDTAREQVNVIHTMSLRLHEMMQRFSSLETEMQFAERAARREPVVMGRAPGSAMAAQEN